MTRAVVIGRSHTNAVAQALTAQEADAGIEVYLLESPNRISRSSTITIDEAKEIARSMPAEAPLLIAMLGTYHNIVGLLRAEPEYDFLLNTEDAPEPAVQSRIPHRAMAASFEDHLKRAGSVRDLKAVTKSPVYILGTPPPKQDNEFLLDKFMRQKRPEYRGRSVADIGIERATTRLKLWKMETELTAKWAASYGIGYLGPPAESVDSVGFLRRDYYNDDATHANAGYGALVIQQILELIETQRAVAQ